MLLTLLVVAGVSLCLEAPKEAAAKAKVEPYFAKVEIQGVLVSTREHWEPMRITIPRRPRHAQYLLDVSKLEGWTEEKLEILSGHIVRVTGTLEFLPVGTRPGVTERRLVIVAKTLQDVDKDVPDIKNE